MFDQALDRGEAVIDSKEIQGARRFVMQDEFAVRAFHLHHIGGFEVVENKIREQVAGLPADVEQHIAVITGATGDGQFRAVGLPDTQRHALPRQETQTLGARGLQVQQDHVVIDRVPGF